ncbi:MAG: chorismate mutase [Acidobacteriaceae bacterium]
MDIAEWRSRIDEIDCRLVELVNQRAAAAQAIGDLKRAQGAPIYEPDRERTIFQNISHCNNGPLSDAELAKIFERIIDVMRSLQRERMEALHYTESKGKS